MPDIQKTERLTIYLIKESFASIADIIDASSALKRFPIPQNGSLGELYIPPAHPKEPKWSRFFQAHVAPKEFGKASSVGALLALNHQGRIFALSFGTGRFCLKQDCWEDRFGLLVALNCIGTNIVKSIDKHSLDVLARHTREQASREATASEFGLDIEQDLLRAVTGTPGDPVTFGKWITGMDTLHVSVPVTIESLPNLLDSVFAKYQETSYRQTFPWVDQITEVRDSNLQTVLNGLLVARFGPGTATTLGWPCRRS